MPLLPWSQPTSQPWTKTNLSFELQSPVLCPSGGGGDKTSNNCPQLRNISLKKYKMSVYKNIYLYATRFFLPNLRNMNYWSFAIVIAQISDNGQILLHWYPWGDTSTSAWVTADLHIIYINLHRCDDEINANIKGRDFLLVFGVSREHSSKSPGSGTGPVTFCLYAPEWVVAEDCCQD